jgi:archaetidylinositol phosphate synthase
MGVAAVAAAVVPGPFFAGVGVVELLLGLFAVVGHLTALQRFLGAWRGL